MEGKTEKTQVYLSGQAEIDKTSILGKVNVLYEMALNLMQEAMRLRDELVAEALNKALSSEDDRAK